MRRTEPGIETRRHSWLSNKSQSYSEKMKS